MCDLGKEGFVSAVKSNVKVGCIYSGLCCRYPVRWGKAGWTGGVKFVEQGPVS